MFSPCGWRREARFIDEVNRSVPRLVVDGPRPAVLPSRPHCDDSRCGR